MNIVKSPNMTKRSNLPLREVLYSTIPLKKDNKKWYLLIKSPDKQRTSLINIRFTIENHLIRISSWL